MRAFLSVGCFEADAAVPQRSRARYCGGGDSRSCCAPGRSARKRAPPSCDRYIGLLTLLQTRVGEQLLMREAEELQRITASSKELLRREEHAVAIAALPCSAEAEVCRNCYLENAADPLACAARVIAFTRCAEESSFAARFPEAT